jgi:hypothetical protein
MEDRGWKMENQLQIVNYKLKIENEMCPASPLYELRAFYSLLTTHYSLLSLPVDNHGICMRK